MTLAEEFRSRNFSKCIVEAQGVKKLADNFGILGIYGQWSVMRVANPSFGNLHSMPIPITSTY